MVYFHLSNIGKMSQQAKYHPSALLLHAHSLCGLFLTFLQLPTPYPPPQLINSLVPMVSITITSTTSNLPVESSLSSS